MLSANAKLHFLSFQNSAMLKVFPFPLLLIIRTLTHALLKTAGNHMGKMETAVVDCSSAGHYVQLDGVFRI